MSSPVFVKPPAPTVADTDADSLQEIINVLVLEKKLAEATPKPSNLDAQLQQLNQRVLLLHEGTSSGGDKTKIKAQIETALVKKAVAFRKAAQHAQASANPQHKYVVTDCSAGGSPASLKVEAEGHIAKLASEAKARPSVEQPVYMQTIRHLGQEIEAYDVYTKWAGSYP